MTSVKGSLAIQGERRNIVEIDPRGMPKVDCSSIEALRQNLGDIGSQEVVERAAFELSDRLYVLGIAVKEGDYEQVKKLSKSISSISMQIGLSEFAIAALNLADCIMAGDKNTIAAVHTRLVHVGETSLIYVVGMGEMYE